MALHESSPSWSTPKHLEIDHYHSKRLEWTLPPATGQMGPLHLCPFHGQVLMELHDWDVGTVLEYCVPEFSIIPLSGIHPLLCQEKKPNCPITLQMHSYLQQNPLYKEAILQYYLQMFRKAQTSYTEQRTHSFTPVKGTVFRNFSMIIFRKLSIQGLCDSPCDNSRTPF